MNDFPRWFPALVDHWPEVVRRVIRTAIEETWQTPAEQEQAGEEIERVIVTRVTDYIDGFGLSTPEEMELEEGWQHFSSMLEASTSTSLPKVEMSVNDPALIQFTGGTTGLPKGAVLTHANLVAGTMACSLWGSAFTGLTPPEKRCVMAVLPYFHVYGTIVVLNWGMFNCATQIIAPRFELDEIMGILEGFDQITFFPAVPTMINAIINHPKATELELGKKLGLFNSGGGPMPMELIEQGHDKESSMSARRSSSMASSIKLSTSTGGIANRAHPVLEWKSI